MSEFQQQIRKDPKLRKMQETEAATGQMRGWESHEQEFAIEEEEEKKTETRRNGKQTEEREEP
jgi:hypothetical protein